jgi:hypothetical protein
MERADAQDINTDLFRRTTQLRGYGSPTQWRMDMAQTVEQLFAKRRREVVTQSVTQRAQSCYPMSVLEPAQREICFRAHT